MVIYLWKMVVYLLKKVVFQFANSWRRHLVTHQGDTIHEGAGGLHGAFRPLKNVGGIKNKYH